MSINRERRKGTGKMIEGRNVNIITDADGKKLVLINDIRFKGKRQIDWDDVKQYLKGYVGDYYAITGRKAAGGRFLWSRCFNECSAEGGV